MSRFLMVLLVLVGATTNSFAIGDSGGCTRPQSLIETASFGTVEQLKVLVEHYVDIQWRGLKSRTRELIQSDARALSEWQKDTKNELINGPVPCADTEWLLGYAVASGNLDVVHWLLDQGVNPTGASRESDSNTIFSRCPAPYPGMRRPDGLPYEEVMKKTIEAYRLLVSRGGDLNRTVGMYSGGYPKNALSQCSNLAMLPILIELGVSRSPSTKEHAPRFAPLQNEVRLALWGEPSALAKAQLLAKDGFNDLRGTQVERDIFERCRVPTNKETCDLLAKLVLVSAGVIPGLPSRSKLGVVVPEEFGQIKEACFFPELQFYSDLDVLAVLGNNGKPLGAAFDWQYGEALQVDVTVNHGANPIILFLQSDRQTLWNVSYTSDTKIAAVVTSSPYSRALNKVVGLSSDVPVYAGTCSRWIHAGLSPPRFFRLDSPDPQALDPLKRPTEEILTIARFDKVVIGDGLTPSRSMMPSATWTLESVGAITTKPEKLEGRAALEALVRSGKLQRSNALVFKRWMDDALASWWPGRIPKTVPPFWDGYYLYEMDKVNLPPGLKGPDAPVIFVHETEESLGDLGDTTIFYLRSARIYGNTRKGGSCYGPRC